MRAPINPPTYESTAESFKTVLVIVNLSADFEIKTLATIYPDLNPYGRIVDLSLTIYPFYVSIL